MEGCSTKRRLASKRSQLTVQQRRRRLSRLASVGMCGLLVPRMAPSRRRLSEHRRLKSLQKEIKKFENVFSF